MPAFDQLILLTPRLRLRPLATNDAPALLTIFSDVRVTQYGTMLPWQSIGDAHAMVDRDVHAMQLGERLRLGIERLDDAALVGTCTLFDLDPLCRSAELGYGLHPQAWGQGYMHEALMALLEYGFSELGLNRVMADVDPRNTASKKSLGRLGFIEEGLLRENCVIDGALADSALYGLLCREWRATVRPTRQSEVTGVALDVEEEVFDKSSTSRPSLQDSAPI